MTDEHRPSTVMPRDDDADARLRAVIDCAPFGAHLYELNGDDLIFVGFNRRAEEMLGLDHSPLIGMTLEDAFPGNAGQETADQYRRVAREGVTWETDEYAYDAEGIAGVFEIIAFPFGPNRMTVFFRDITEKRRLEVALRQNEERFSRFLASMQQGFAYCRLIEDDAGVPLDWVFLDANDHFARDYTGRALIGKLASQIWPDLKTEHREFLDACLRVASSGRGEFVEVETTPETWRSFALASTEPSHFVVVGTDITRVKQAELDAFRRQTELERAQERLEGLLKNIVGTMGKVVETRDPYTQGHETSVAAVSRAIAVEMGLSDEEVDGIEVAALVHDIGKLAVPAEILTKPGALDDVEFMIIQQHPKTGHDILSTIDFGWPVADVVLQHHERLDGSGYPNGLKGDQIMRGARIVAVADVVEAMGSHRPYRPSLGIDEALKEVVGHPEKFDPEAASACQRLFEIGRLTLPNDGGVARR